MFILPRVEFYITNVCNLACPGCNRFNNYKFRGFQRWEDYKHDYKQWANEIRFTSHMGILGGEPFLNPDIMSWIDGIHTLWPNTKLNVITNAYRLNQVPGLYEYLLNHRRVHIKVGIHNKTKRKFITGEVEKFLQAPLIYSYNNSNIYQEMLTITDANGISVLIEYNWWFHQGSLIKDLESDNFSLYNSNPTVAHNNCSMKYCHTFSNGRLYKCGVAALLPDFDKQYTINLSPEDRALMLDYPGIGINDSTEVKQQFIGNIRDEIPQCKFCPEVYKGDQIFAEEKKVLFKK
jgi:organic radical activating enzyme